MLGCICLNLCVLPLLTWCQPGSLCWGGGWSASPTPRSAPPFSHLRLPGLWETGFPRGWQRPPRMGLGSLFPARGAEQEPRCCMCPEVPPASPRRPPSAPGPDPTRPPVAHSPPPSAPDPPLPPSYWSRFPLSCVPEQPPRPVCSKTVPSFRPFQVPRSSSTPRSTRVPQQPPLLPPPAPGAGCSSSPQGGAAPRVLRPGGPLRSAAPRRPARRRVYIRRRFRPAAAAPPAPSPARPGPARSLRLPSALRVNAAPPPRGLPRPWTPATCSPAARRGT